MRISSQPIITARSKCSSIGQIANSGRAHRAKYSLATSKIADRPSSSREVSPLSLEQSLRVLCSQPGKVSQDTQTAGRLIAILKGAETSRKELNRLGANIEGSTVIFPLPSGNRPLTILENWTDVQS